MNKKWVNETWLQTASKIILQWQVNIVKDQSIKQFLLPTNTLAAF